jgi:integrase/recombinase XerD
MTSITLSRFTHRNKRCVSFTFSYNFNVKEYVKKGPNTGWTKTHRCFYVVDQGAALKTMCTYLKAGGYNVIYKTAQSKELAKNPLESCAAKLTQEKQTAYDQFIDFLIGKRFSDSTVKVYGHFVLGFLKHSHDTSLKELNENNVRHYIETTVGTLNYAVSTHRQMVSSLKHFAFFYPACSIHTDAIYMPRKDKKLPVILSVEEILRLLKITKNLKHKTIIAVLYASGLRVGELITLELKDFDFTRNQLHIRNSKGRKDRYATIAVSLHPLLKNYHDAYKPKTYFIENPKGGPYSANSIRAFLKKGCTIAGIKKKVTPHSLRHSYATHLLEHGTDIRYIQELLGHSRPETTMMYTQVTQKSLRDIQSPLDTTLNNLSLRDDNNRKILFL